MNLIVRTLMLTALIASGAAAAKGEGPASSPPLTRPNTIGKE